MSSKLAFLSLLLLLLFPYITSTLSKSNPKGTHNSEDYDDEEGEERQERKQKKSKLMEYSHHVQDEESLQDILGNHNHLDTDDSKTSFIKLAYVTPWNNHGYDVAKWAAKKFTHIAPVWFQFTPKLFGNDLACEITGQHDIDQNWIDDIRLNNTAMKIVPRFLFEVKDSKLAQKFLKDQKAQIRCVDAMDSLLKKMRADGLVLEAYLQILSSTKSQEGIQLGIDFIGRAGRRFKKHNKISIVPLTPPVSDNGPIFNAEIIAPLCKDVDYINLMTYDYIGQQYPGLAPAPWILVNLEFLKEIDESFLAKTLLGVNYYGACKDGGIQHVFGQSAVDLVEESEILAWDEETKQHIIELEDRVCSIPTKRNLEARLEIVEEYNLPGIAIWDLGQGFDHFTEVL
ncbi:unnamed protein product [Bursaphelenchus xylophilus]|uniref:Chitinase domain-containing protein 1 n=1 Tax=Bursaphelenchus xylophilus TaxID=6326 RepID=A0A1I7SLF1_BURXY|nr:unnamed protein product [Bursaphelenchus xylophilus]CAG9129546.1 unnamed protein product [Bursaphelenchus xylophilus]